MALQDKITIQVAGKDKEIFMSYGLVLKLTSIFQNGIEDVAPAAQNPEYHMALVNIALSGKDGDKEVSDHGLSLEDGGALLDWIFGHVTNFFASAMGRTLKISNEVHETILEATEAGKELIEKAKL